MDTASDGFSTLDLVDADALAGPQIIPVLEEFATIEKQIVATGTVKIFTSITQETVTINISIVNESYEVHHFSGSPDLLDIPPCAWRKQGDTTIIMVIREVSVVVKKYVVVEEIHITRHLTQTPLTQEISLRKEQVQVERTFVHQ